MNLKHLSLPKFLKLLQECNIVTDGARPKSNGKSNRRNGDEFGVVTRADVDIASRSSAARNSAFISDFIVATVF